MSTATGFELTNVAAGPDPLSLRETAADHDFVLLLFQRDYHCGNCRSQVQAFADQYDDFEARNTEIVSIVPEPPDRLRDWQAEYDLPFPLCADPDAETSSAYDQPVRFGLLGSLSDLLGRMPKAVLLDTRGDSPTVVYTHEGSSTWDRPEIEEILGEIEDSRDETHGT
jgi:peroxiredoxin Q/BCP